MIEIESGIGRGGLATETGSGIGGMRIEAGMATGGQVTLVEAVEDGSTITITGRPDGITAGTALDPAETMDIRGGIGTGMSFPTILRSEKTTITVKGRLLPLVDL